MQFECSLPPLGENELVDKLHLPYGGRASIRGPRGLQMAVAITGDECPDGAGRTVSGASVRGAVRIAAIGASVVLLAGK